MIKAASHKKLICFLLVLSVLFSLIPEVFAREETEYINIDSESDLIAFASNCRLDTYSENKVVTLTSDITLTKEFTPIPVFSGTFDGQYHTISGMSVTEMVTYAGLFGILTESAEVKDLHVSGVVAPSGDISGAGGIAAENNGIIDNCVFTGYVRGEKVTGGIAGNNNGTIMNCANYGYVNVDIKDGKITLSDIKSFKISDASKILSIGTLKACENTGGIAGYNSGIISSCENSGTVGTSQNGYSTGGIAGSNEGYITLSTNKGSIYGKSKTGGIVGQTLPYVKKNYSEDLLTGPKSEIDTILEIVESVTYDLDANTDNLTTSINAMLSTISSASNHAKGIVNEVKSFGNGKITEVNEIVAFANTAIDGLGDVTEEFSGTGEKISNAVGDVKKALNVVTSAKTEEDIISALPQAANYINCAIQDMSGMSTQISNVINEVNEMVNDLGDIGLPSFSTIPDSLTDSIGYLTNDISTISYQAKNLMNAVNTTEKTLTSDIRTITGEAKNVSNSIFDTVYSLSDITVSDFVKDTSGDVVEEGDSHYGIIESCLNTGCIESTDTAGGIAGAMNISGIPSVTDNKDGSGVTLKTYQYRSIICYCRNYGYVNCEGDNAGSICGAQKIGAVSDCQGYGTVTSNKGVYVGGISGLCDGLVRNCFVRSSLYGTGYVGGIIGQGSNSGLLSGGSSLSNNYAKVSIDGCLQHNGGISGSDEGTFLCNYYVANELNGIGTYSIEYSAAPISMESLLNADNCPEEFTWSESKLMSAATATDESTEFSVEKLLSYIMLGLLFVFVVTVSVILMIKNKKKKNTAKNM